MQDDELIDKVLMHLQGYIVESDNTETISEEETVNESENNTDETVEEVISNLQETTTTSSISTTREETISDLQYDKKLSSREILSFYNLTISYVLSYLNREELPTITTIEDDTEVTTVNPVVCDGICMWTAGKIWQKYNVRVNNNEDETNVLGYGDKLVIQAKELLKPFKYYKMMVY